MKKKYLIFSFLLCSFTVITAQNWETAFNTGGAYNQSGIGTARDNNDNRIVVGLYNTSAAVFSGTLSLINAGGYDGFTVKYSPGNTPIWGARVSGSGSSYNKSTTTDEFGNIYVCGKFSGTCEFRHGDPSGAGGVFATLTALSTTYDGYVIKFNSSGTILWVNRLAASTLDDEITNVIYRNGTLAIAGAVNANCSTSGFNLVAGPYIAKINPANGNAYWAYNCPTGGGASSSNVQVKSYLCIDNGGNIYVHNTGNNGGVVYGLSSSVTITTNTGSSVYAKYSNAGTVLWARATATSNNSTHVIGRSIVADDNGNVYVSGAISGAGNHTIYFPATGSSMTISTSIGSHSYVGKIDGSTGLMLWVRHQSAVEDIELAVQSCNMLYAALHGSTGGTVNGTGGTSFTLGDNYNYIVKFYYTGELLSTASNVWHLTGTSQYPHLNPWKASIDFVNELHLTSVVPLTGGGNVTLVPSGIDIVAATIKDLNPFTAPSISLSSSPSQICAGQSTTLNAVITGSGGPFTITWNVYNGTSWVPYPGSINSTTLPLTSTNYTPYILYNPVLNSNICQFQIVVTNCSGTSYTANTFFIVYSPITYGMTTAQTVCLNNQNLSAVFTVSAPNAWAYSWEVSCNGGASWSDLTSAPGYTGQDSPTLTITSVTIGMNGCLYRCVLEGNFCSDVITNTAILNVIASCRIGEIGNENTDTSKSITEFVALKVFPNPANKQFTISGMKGASKITILSIDGRNISTEQFSNDSVAIDISNLSAGIYIITVEDELGVRAEQLIKQ